VIVSYGYLPNMAARWSGAGLRRHAGMRYALLDAILEELARDGKIRIEGEIITLNARQMPLS
jgi:hypothetical protein